MYKDIVYVIGASKPTREVKLLKERFTKYGVAGDMVAMVITESKLLDFSRSMSSYMTLPTNPPLPWNRKYIKIKDPRDSSDAFDRDFEEYFNQNKDIFTEKYMGNIMVYCKSNITEDADVIETLDGMTVVEKFFI